MSPCGPNDWDYYVEDGSGFEEGNAARFVRQRDKEQAAEFARTGWPVGEDDDEMGDVT